MTLSEFRPLVRLVTVALFVFAMSHLRDPAINAEGIAGTGAYNHVMYGCDADTPLGPYCYTPGTCRWQADPPPEGSYSICQCEGSGYCGWEAAESCSG